MFFIFLKKLQGFFEKTSDFTEYISFIKTVSRIIFIFLFWCDVQELLAIFRELISKNYTLLYLYMVLGTSKVFL